MNRSKIGLISTGLTVLLLIGSIAGLAFSFKVMNSPLTTVTNAQVCTPQWNIQLNAPETTIAGKVKAGQRRFTWTSNTTTAPNAQTKYSIRIDDTVDGTMVHANPATSECNFAGEFDICTPDQMGNQKSYIGGFTAGHTYKIWVNEYGNSCGYWKKSNTITVQAVSCLDYCVAQGGLVPECQAQCAVPTATPTKTPTPSGGGGASPTPTGGAGNSCSCTVPRSPTDNFCGHYANTTNCPMTQPGGYCDPNGDGNYSDASTPVNGKTGWQRGFDDYKAQCTGGGGGNSCFSSMTLSSSTVSAGASFECKFNYGGGLTGDHLNCVVLKNGQPAAGATCTFKSKTSTSVSFNCTAPSADGTYDVEGYMYPLSQQTNPEPTTAAACFNQKVSTTLTVGSGGGGSNECFSNMNVSPSTVAASGDFTCNFNFGGGLTGNHLNCAVLQNGQPAAGASCTYNSRQGNTVKFDCKAPSANGSYTVQGYMYPLSQQTTPEPTSTTTGTTCFDKNVTGTLTVGSGGATSAPTPTGGGGGGTTPTPTTGGGGVNPTPSVPATTVSPTPAACTATDLAAPKITSPVPSQWLVGILEGTNTITWDAVTGASKYSVWIDDIANGWVGDCSKPQNAGDICNENVTGTSFSSSFVNGHKYNVWIGAVNSCGSAKNKAGLRLYGTTAACMVKMPAPTIIEPLSGTVSAGVHSIKWSAVTNASGYGLRINDLSNGWGFGGDCSEIITSNTGDVCIDHMGTSPLSYDYAFQTGHSYAVWAAAENSCNWGGTAAGVSISVPASGTVTPTVSTTAAATPTPTVCSPVAQIDWRVAEKYTRSVIAYDGTNVVENIALHLKTIVEEDAIIEVSTDGGSTWAKAERASGDDIIITLLNKNLESIYLSVRATNPCGQYSAVLTVTAETVPLPTLTPAQSPTPSVTLPPKQALAPAIIVGGAILLVLIVAAGILGL